MSSNFLAPQGDFPDFQNFQEEGYPPLVNRIIISTLTLLPIEEGYEHK
jgi:hypothetical protein